MNPRYATVTIQVAVHEINRHQPSPGGKVDPNPAEQKALSLDPVSFTIPVASIDDFDFTEFIKFSADAACEFFREDANSENHKKAALVEIEKELGEDHPVIKLAKAKDGST